MDTRNDFSEDTHANNVESIVSDGSISISEHGRYTPPATHESLHTAGPLGNTRLSQGSNISITHDARRNDQTSLRENTEPHKEQIHIRPPLSTKEKLGVLSILFFTVGTVFALAAFGMICFLWFANDNNTLWCTIVSKNWLAKSATICAEIIKQSISFQIAAAVAMIASLVLEGGMVVLPHTASLTMMRACAGSGTVLTLLWYQLVGSFSARATVSLRMLVLIILFSVTFLATQAFSIFLVSDITQAFVLGSARTVNTTFGFNATSTSVGGIRGIQTISQVSTWTRIAAIYPTFAEYSEKPYLADGVKDTGVTLRAFLPFQDAVDRETISEYIGNTTVIDTRVTCQIPTLIGEVVIHNGSDMLIIQGAVTQSRETPRLGIYHFSGSGYTIPNGINMFGSAYMVINVTLGSAQDWNLGFTGDSGRSATPPAYSERGEWLDLAFANGNLVLSTSLCYTAFGQADLPVHMYSSTNRSESTPAWNSSTSKYTFEFLRERFGQYESWSPEERGIMRMKNQSWLADPDLIASGDSVPYLFKYSGFGNPETASIGSGTNVSAVFYSGGVDVATPDIMHIWLVQEILQSGGSVAFAIQSLFTLLSSITYYDNLGGFDKIGPVQQRFLALGNIPSSYRGFIAVTTTLSLHFVLMAVVLYLFLTGTKISRLGATWAALAQAIRGETAIYIQTADILGDEDVTKLMEEHNTAKALVKLHKIEGNVSVIAT
ncbi:hypothetical protein N431DRAFT_335687 [Stipitochalara longipes BDJ]|nr:hypothetical protein N431DRAFT_335687 [Stipitochalara longipes BDJ]